MRNFGESCGQGKEQRYFKFLLKEIRGKGGRAVDDGGDLKLVLACRINKNKEKVRRHSMMSFIEVREIGLTVIITAEILSFTSSFFMNE